jgi:hypothetical protein
MGVDCMLVKLNKHRTTESTQFGFSHWKLKLLNQNLCSIADGNIYEHHHNQNRKTAKQTWDSIGLSHTRAHGKQRASRTAMHPDRRNLILKRAPCIPSMAKRADQTTAAAQRWWLGAI